MLVKQFIGFIRFPKGKKCIYDKDTHLKEFADSSTNISDPIISRNECEKYCSETENCWGCSVSCQTKCQWSAISECKQQEHWDGSIHGDITQKPGTCYSAIVVEIWSSFF